MILILAVELFLNITMPEEDGNLHRGADSGQAVRSGEWRQRFAQTVR